jgi:hypothetical protein
MRYGVCGMREKLKAQAKRSGVPQRRSGAKGTGRRRRASGVRHPGRLRRRAGPACAEASADKTWGKRVIGDR